MWIYATFRSRWKKSLSDDCAIEATAFLYKHINEFNLQGEDIVDELVCVDVFDRGVGRATKEECHRKDILHRAFSVFIVHDEKMLLQRRAKGKYHSGGLWTNACCSHPRAGDALDDAVQRRLYEELGIRCECEEIASFVYHHKFQDALYEYEYDHVFIGRYFGEIKPDPEEIMDTKWIDLSELANSLRSNPDIYTVWFKTAAPMVLKKLQN